jgi:mannitol/fructose-specific phosphotransferase system IIA component (Ntr-type)
MGWDEMPAAERFIFGSISDQLLSDPRVHLLLCRITHPPRLARRIFLAVPPLAEREPGCVEGLRLVRNVSRQAGAEVIVLAEPAGLSQLEEILNRGKPVIQVEPMPLGNWEALLEPLERHVLPDDMLLLWGARRGAVSWIPSLDRLPQILARRFREVNLLALYPATEVPGENLETTMPIEFVLQPDHIEFDLPQNSIEEVIRRLLSPVCDRLPDLMPETISRLAQQDILLDPTPGLAFCHTRLTGLESIWLGIGISREGLGIAESGQRLYVLIVLLTPEDTPSDQHLFYLRKIAERLGDPGTLARLRLARSREEVEALLRDPQTAVDPGRVDP